MAGENEVTFKYVFGEKDSLLLVILTGRVTGRETPLFEAFAEELCTKSQPIVLLNFRDIESFMPACFTQFAKLQKALREQKKLIGICSLKPEMKKSLLMAGIVRDAEVFNNIPDAWKKLVSLLEQACLAGKDGKKMDPKENS